MVSPRSLQAEGGVPRDPTPLSRLFSAGPSLQQIRPTSTAAVAPVDSISQLQAAKSQLSRIQPLYHQTLLTLIKDKRHKETVLAWFATTLRANTMSLDQTRAHAVNPLAPLPIRDSLQLLCNLCYIGLNLCKPFFASTAKGHDGFKR